MSTIGRLRGSVTTASDTRLVPVCGKGESTASVRVRARTNVAKTDCIIELRGSRFRLRNKRLQRHRHLLVDALIRLGRPGGPDVSGGLPGRGPLRVGPKD